MKFHLEDEGLKGDDFGTFEDQDPTDPDNTQPDRSSDVKSRWADGINNE